jgi:hypothetical protein
MSFLNISNRHDIRSRENFYNFSLANKRYAQETATLTPNTVDQQLNNLKRDVLAGANSSVRNAFTTGDFDTLNIPSVDLFNLYNAAERDNPLGDTATINDPLRVAEKMSSDRDLETGKDFCKNRRTKYGLFDTYGRLANQNSVHWSDCAGDDPMVAIDRDRYIQRMEFESYAPYQVSIPKGLLL